MPHFLRNYQPVFQTGCIILHHYHQQCVRVQVVPHLSQHSILSIFFILDILINVYWYLLLVLICIFLINKDVEHFKCFISISHNLHIYIICNYTGFIYATYVIYTILSYIIYVCVCIVYIFYNKVFVYLPNPFIYWDMCPLINE